MPEDHQAQRHSVNLGSAQQFPIFGSLGSPLSDGMISSAYLPAPQNPRLDMSDAASRMPWLFDDDSDSLRCTIGSPSLISPNTPSPAKFSLSPQVRDGGNVQCSFLFPASLQAPHSSAFMSSTSIPGFNPPTISVQSPPPPSPVPQSYRPPMIQIKTPASLSKVPSRFETGRLNHIPVSWFSPSPLLQPSSTPVMSVTMTPIEGDPSRPENVSLWFVPGNTSADMTAVINDVCSAADKDEGKHLARYIGYTTPNVDSVGLVCEPFDMKSSLEQQMENGLSLTRTELLSLCKNIATGLQSLHERGFAHGRFSPAYVQVDGISRTKAKLFGYGLAHIMQKMKGISSQLEDDQLIQQKQWLDIRKPWFIAPEEVATGENWTPASDVYGLGVMMVLLMTRRSTPPIPESFDFSSHAQASIKRGEKHIVRVPPEVQFDYGFARIADKCCRVDPKRRPSISDVVQALNNLLSLSA